MAQNTITTLSILKSLAKVKLNLDYDEDFDSVSDFVDQTADLVFENYPIFDESYRHRLNVKIMEHFLFDETNVTPYGRWMYMINRKMCEIMPYYNQLYESELLVFDPLGDTNLTESIIRDLETDTKTNVDRSQDIENTRNTTGSRSTDSQVTSSANENTLNESESESWNAETPYNRNTAKNNANEVSGEKSENDVVSNMSGTQSEVSGTDTDETSTADERLTAESESLQDVDSHEEILKTLKGKRSGISINTLLKEYRDNMLNIDMMIIKELEVLFRFILN